MPVFRLHLVMFFVIITKFWLDIVFRIPTWLEDNLPFFEHFRKIELTIFLRKARWWQSTSSSLLIYIHKNTYVPWRTASTIQTNGDHHHFLFGYQSCTCPCSGLFCWQNPYSGVVAKEIDLVVVLEYSFFHLCCNIKQIS